MKSQYHLEINDSRWGLSAAEEAKAWLKKFTSVMNLKKNDDKTDKQIKFVRNDPLSHLKNTNGVKQYRLRDLSFIESTDSSLILCDIGLKAAYEDEITKMWLALFPIYHNIQKQGGYPFHGALIRRKDFGFLMMAPSRTGKSTCCRRMPDDWQVLSDDDTVAYQTANGQVFAHPFPTWSEHRNIQCNLIWDVQKSYSLNAFFFLERSEKDEIIPVGPGLSSMLINNSISDILYFYSPNFEIPEYKEYKKISMLNACKMAKILPSFILRASLNGDFYEKIDEAITNVR